MRLIKLFFIILILFCSAFMPFDEKIFKSELESARKKNLLKPLFGGILGCGIGFMILKKYKKNFSLYRLSGSGLSGILLSSMIPIDMASNYLKSAILKYEKNTQDKELIVTNMYSSLNSLKIQESIQENKNYFSKSYQKLSDEFLEMTKEIAVDFLKNNVIEKEIVLHKDYYKCIANSILREAEKTKADNSINIYYMFIVKSKKGNDYSAMINCLPRLYDSYKKLKIEVEDIEIKKIVIEYIKSIIERDVDDYMTNQLNKKILRIKQIDIILLKIFLLLKKII